MTSFCWLLSLETHQSNARTVGGGVMKITKLWHQLFLGHLTLEFDLENLTLGIWHPLNHLYHQSWSFRKNPQCPRKVIWNSKMEGVWKIKDFKGQYKAKINSNFLIQRDEGLKTFCGGGNRNFLEQHISNGQLKQTLLKDVTYLLRTNQNPCQVERYGTQYCKLLTSLLPGWKLLLY